MQKETKLRCNIYWLGKEQNSCKTLNAIQCYGEEKLCTTIIDKRASMLYLPFIKETPKLEKEEETGESSEEGETMTVLIFNYFKLLSNNF